MQKFLLALLLLIGTRSLAQYKVTFYIDRFPTYYNKNNQVYIAGPFTGWKPDSANFCIQNDSITIDAPKGILEYKFTGGSWERVETGADNTTMDNRKTDIENDTTIHITIQNWADHFPAMKKHSTATKNVHLMDSAFYMPQLNRYRRIWLYLPESYVTSRKQYPVIYMQDGQNLFDEATAFAGEWGIDETMDTLTSESYPEAIIVAIDNGAEKRMNEYSPYDVPGHGRGEGDQYVDFLVHTLKPYIDQHYRTYKSRKHTFVAGSSMGGLISFYAILKYPKVFGGAGVFSPSFWVSSQLKNDIAKKGKKVRGKIYFYVGKGESEHMVTDMLAVFEQLHRLSKANMTTVIRTDGKHNEGTWGQEFPLFYKWLMQ